MPNNLQFAFDPLNPLQGPSANSNGNGNVMNVGGMAGVGLQVVSSSGTFNARLNPEGTIDDSTFAGLFAINLFTGAVSTSITTTGIYFVPTPGIDQFRCRISDWQSGLVTVYAKAVTVSPFQIVVSPASATAGPLNLAQVGGAAIAIGQAAMAASVPVAIASNQSAIPVSGNFTDGTTPGQVLKAASKPVVFAADQFAYPTNLPAQPAGGDGPLQRVPTVDDKLTVEVAQTNELLRQIIALMAFGLSP